MGKFSSGYSVEDFDESGSIAIENQFSISHSPVQYEFAVEPLALMNPKMLRGNIEWVECVKDRIYGSRIYDYSHYETILDNLDSIGVEFLGCFVYGWGWWPQDTFYELPQEEWPDYFHFVENFTHHFQGRIKYYEIWNEPDIGFWRQTDEEFYQFSRNITQIIHDTDPTAKILSPGVTGPNIGYLENYIANLTDEGFSDMFDIFAFHAYSGINGEYLSEKLWQARDFLDRHNFFGELWITEFGLSTGVANTELIDTYLTELETHQATQVLKQYSQCIAYNISRAFWYCHLDWCDTGELNGGGRFGLMACVNQTTHTYEAKPSGYTYQIFNSLITNGTYYPAGIQKKGLFGKNIWSYYFLTPQNTVACVFWTRDVSNRISLSFVSPNSNKVEFAVKQYDYITNTSNILAQSSSELSIGLEYDPILLELNYSEWISSNGMGFQPLTLIIKVRPDLKISLYILFVPLLLGVAFTLTVKQHLLLKKGRKNHA